MDQKLIQRIRVNLGMNQNEFSMFLGVSLSEISLVEAGYRDASDKLVGLITEKVSPEFIALVKRVLQYGE